MTRVALMGGLVEVQTGASHAKHTSTLSDSNDKLTCVFVTESFCAVSSRQKVASLFGTRFSCYLIWATFVFSPVK